jgi:hypothetical protein
VDLGQVKVRRRALRYHGGGNERAREREIDMDAKRKTIRRRAWAALGACALLSSAAALAADGGPQVWVNPGLYSYHFNRDKGYRDDNIGYGIEVHLTDDHALLAGSFVNSDRARTHYGAYQWRPLHWDPAGIHTSAGIVLGAFDGYPRYRNGGWFVAPLPTLAFEGRRVGLNVALIPNIPDRVSGALSFQVKVRLW